MKQQHPESRSATELLKHPFDHDVSRMWVERARKEKLGRKMAQQPEKNAHRLAPDWVIRFRNWWPCVCVCARICVLTPFHALSRTHHSLWICGVLLSPWIWRTAHQWAALIWSGGWSGGVSVGVVGWGGGGVTDREMEDSIRHAISQAGTLARRDRSGPSISLHYPQPQGH